MSVSLVVIRLELAGHSPVPADFGFSAAAGEMSNEEIKKKTLASAAACLEGKSPGEKAAIIHQHLGRRADQHCHGLSPQPTLFRCRWEAAV
ncbi:rCG21794, isoform CRA_c [Rattus norvegicus]|uniref:RCG21794, isoform CRA_c n=1 Tax=Rattus norvegicus TaxID=10116 RepID=A6J1D3_RAT|nr:rCG21794, isoform CRA_c [Rattus norvegicus]